MDFRGLFTMIEGDATHPVGPGNKIIVHICNDKGYWGAGFTGSLSVRWLRPQIAYQHYKCLHAEDDDLELGMVQFVHVDHDIWVANVVGQHGTRRGPVPPIRYNAVRKGLRRVARMAGEIHATVHMPKIGCGLGGGDWDVMQPIINEQLCNVGVNVTVYEPATEVRVETVVNEFGDY
jgi:O-acetyl-ADP-ribose deacetylase (regulator of RNase III)